MEAAKAAGVDQNDDVTRGRTFWYAKLTFKDNAARDKVISSFFHICTGLA